MSIYEMFVLNKNSFIYFPITNVWLGLRCWLPCKCFVVELVQRKAIFRLLRPWADRKGRIRPCSHRRSGVLRRCPSRVWVIL